MLNYAKTCLQNLATANTLEPRYAPRQTSKNITKTKCSKGTWENMEKFIECVPGCEDITEDTGGRKSLVKKRSGSYAPFVAGL